MGIENIVIHEEVAEALDSGVGIVALESTVISHGLPEPLNLECALELEAIVRTFGAIPATIGMIDGMIKVGLLKNELCRLADPKAQVLKLSRRDLAFALSTRSLGATTVASTMLIANLAGIRVFATGGIGGVHRGAEQSFDISADILELSRTPVAVVCAGAKSILDLPKTLEMLESYGVPVYGYKSSYFPEFYCQGQRYYLHMHFDSVDNITNAIKIHNNLGLNNGILITQNVPADKALEADFIEQIICESEDIAKKAQIRGKELTPFLLKEIALRTKSQSIESNIALLKNNAQLGALIAKSYALLSRESKASPNSSCKITSGVAGTGNLGNFWQR